MTKIVRTSDTAANDPVRARGEKVQNAINFAAEQGGSLQISVEDIDLGLVFITVRPWQRRG